MYHEFTGQYSINNKTPEAASFKLGKNKLQIILQAEFGKPKIIYWYYDKIIKERSVANTFKHSDFPPQYIQSWSSEFSSLLEEKINRSKKSFFSRQGLLLTKVLLGIFALILFSYFFVLPWLATAIANKFPLDYEKSIGEEAFNSMKNDFVIDEKKTAYANDFFQQLNFETKYDIKITVVKSDIANAFALPGGNIVIYDKILNGMSSYHELAALLSHEFIHVQNRHSLRGLIRQLGATIFLSLIIGDVNAVGAVVLSNADNLKTLSYSRSLETEADEDGLKLLSERKMDCNGFVRLFQLLKKEDKVEVSEWISSHPDIDNRIENITSNELRNQINVVTDSTLYDLFMHIKSAE